MKLTKLALLVMFVIASASSTLAASSANENHAAKIPPASARFVDNGDGTITDTKTGLMWEKKLALTDSRCANFNHLYNDIHCQTLGHGFAWVAYLSNTGLPEGPVFTEFLTLINRADGTSSDGLTQNRRNYSDWRVPTVAELRSILLSGYPCNSNPCIDPVFGPTVPDFYWTSTGLSDYRELAWAVRFSDGAVMELPKSSFAYVRAVRGGR